MVRLVIIVSLFAVVLAPAIACGSSSDESSGITPPANTMDAAMSADSSPEAGMGTDASTGTCTVPAVAITHTGTVANAPARVLLDATKYPNAVCNDGTPASYVIRPGTGAAATRWVILVGGGGACYDQTSCASRASATPSFITSNGSAPVLTADGILSTDASLNPDFYDASHVTVPYCSSDAWSGAKSGTGTFNANDISTWSFQGHAIIQAILADITASHGFSAATEVLLTGDSAGGVGAFVNLTDVAALVPHGARYLAYGDAAFANHVDDFSATGAAPNYLNTTGVPTQEADYMRGVPTWNGRGDKICDATATNTLEKLQCYDAQFLLAPGGPITMPTLVTVSQKDTVQVTTAGVSVSDLQSGTLTTAEAGYVAFFSSNMRSNLESTNSGVSFFSPDAVLHVEQTVKDLYNVPYAFPSGQLTYQQALGAWYKDPCVAKRNLAN